ncbi:MAG: aminotransferase class IV [Phycisphaerae bacterium]
MVYFNGEIVPEAEAGVRIDDGGWLHGAGLFETMVAQGGHPFRYEQHIRRLMNSAAKLLRPIDRTDLPAPSDIESLLRRNELADARLRLTVTAGSMRSGDDTADALTVCVTAFPLATYAAELYEKGVRVIVTDSRVSTSDPLAGHKTTCYLPRLLALREARAARCFEAIWFTTQARLAEGSISNVFLVRGDALRTPPLDTPVLPGIARHTVIELARQNGLTVEQSPLTIDDLLEADEVFLTNVMMKVLPVVTIEKHKIGDEQVGAHTKTLAWAFEELIREECGQDAT